MMRASGNGQRFMSSKEEYQAIWKKCRKVWTNRDQDLNKAGLLPGEGSIAERLREHGLEFIENVFQVFDKKKVLIRLPRLCATVLCDVGKAQTLERRTPAYCITSREVCAWTGTCGKK